MIALLRQGFRSLRREPLIFGLAVLALGIGIGLPTAMYGLMDAALLRGLPVDEPHEIVSVERRRAGATGEGMGAAARDYLAWRDARAFEHVAAMTTTTATVRADAGAERRPTAALTPSTFALLGSDAALGRTFEERDGTTGAPPVALLSETFWQERFGADPDVLGRTVFVDGVAHTVVGVMPPDFRFPSDQDVWVPLVLDDAVAARDDGPTVFAFARLRDGVSAGDARAEMAVIAAHMARAYPDTNAALETVVLPFTERFMGANPTRQMWIVFGAVLLVLVVACTNVAGLLLVRAVRRSNEIAVLAAIGAGRTRLIARMLAESAILAAFGGIAGAAVAAGALGLLRRGFGARLPYWAEPRLDPAVLLFAFATTATAALLAGLLPALRVTRGNLAGHINDVSRGSTGLRIGRLMHALVVVEVALSIGLLAATGGLVRSVARVQADRLGLPGDEVSQARVTLPDSYASESRHTFFRQVEDALAADPGVAAVALATSVPAARAPFIRYRVEGESYDDDERPIVRYAAVSPGFFDVFRIAPLRGRVLDARDRADGEPVAVVTRKFAQHHFGNEEVLGRRLRIGDESAWRTIVGLVPERWIGGLDASDDRNPRGIYVPLAQSAPATIAIAVRATQGSGLSLAPAVREAVAAIDRDVPVYDVASMPRVVADHSWHYGLVAGILGVCAIAALLLAVIGVYGVIAFSVGQRTREFGVRMALGATPRDVVRNVLGRGALQVGLGTAFGIALGLLLTRALAGLLFEVSPTDPAVFGATVGAIALVGGAAMLVPALRAARTEPLVALRGGARPAGGPAAGP